MAIKTVGRTVDEMVIPGSEGMKFAWAKTPSATTGRSTVRAPAWARRCDAGSADGAQNYLAKLERAAAEGKAHTVDRDLKNEQLVRC